MLLQIAEPECAGLTTEKLRARGSPDQLGRGVAIDNAEMAVDDHDGIARLLKRSEQELGTFGRRAIAGAHRSTRGTADNRRRSTSTAKALIAQPAYRPDNVESVCLIRNHGTELLICLRFH
jgi:hypothetical protein